MKTLLEINYNNKNYKLTSYVTMQKDNGLGGGKPWLRKQDFKVTKYILWCNGEDICECQHCKNEKELRELIDAFDD